MRSVLITLALAVTAALSARAAEVTTFEFGNGMDVVVIEDHRAPVVVHMVWYRVGAADEHPGVSGVAHYLEHLMFKGTDELEPGEFSRVVADNGGTNNAFTSYDYTGYYQRVAADRLGLMMEMEADRMRDLDLDGRDIATELRVVQEERNQRIENDPGALFSEQRDAAQYLNHPYGRPIIGWMHEVEALTLEDAVNFYETYYAPNNAILIVAGDVSPEEVRALAEEHYGPLEPSMNLPERIRPQEPLQLAERRLTHEDPRVAQPYVVRTYLAAERDPGDQRKAAALTLLADILGDGQTSELSRRLQFGTREALYTSAFYRGTSLDDTVFGVLVVPAPNVSLEEAEAALDRELAAFIEDGVDPAQLERIKMQMRAGEIYEADSVESLARRYGSALTSGLSVDDVEAWPGILQSISEDEIIAAAREVFDRDRAVTGYLTGPEDRAAPAAAADQPAPAVSLPETGDVTEMAQ